MAGAHGMAWWTMCFARVAATEAQAYSIEALAIRMEHAFGEGQLLGKNSLFVRRLDVLLTFYKYQMFSYF